MNSTLPDYLMPKPTWVYSSSRVSNYLLLPEYLGVQGTETSPRLARTQTDEK